MRRNNNYVSMLYDSQGHLNVHFLTKFKSLFEIALMSLNTAFST
jgi:hypothetical protein